MKHIVIDVESLSILPHPVITQFAAVCMDNGDIQQDPFTRNLNIEEQIRKGAIIDSDTMSWWMDQDHSTFEDTILDSIHLNPFCASLKQWFDNNIAPNEEFLVWASDPLLDFGGIVKLHEVCGRKVPWNHRQQRDARTLRSLTEMRFKGDDPRLPVRKAKVMPTRPHHALSDAVALATEISRNCGLMGIDPW